MEELALELRSRPIVSVDTETTSLRRDARLCGLSFSWASGEAVYVPTLSPQPENHLTQEEVLSILRPVLEDPAVPKCGHNVKFDAGVLLRCGVRLQGVCFDTMLASTLTDPCLLYTSRCV